MSVFDKAKKKKAVKKSPKDSHPRLKPIFESGDQEVESDEFFDNIKQLEEKEKQKKAVEAKIKLLKSEISEPSVGAYLAEYEKIGRNPGTVMVESVKDGETGQFMLVTKDAYAKIDEERAEELEEMYGEEVYEELVEKTTEYSFDANVLEKHFDVISEALDGLDIPEEDKENLLKATEKYKIKSGAIDNLKSLTDKVNSDGDLDETSISEMFEEITPIIAMQKYQVIK